MNEPILSAKNIRRRPRLGRNAMKKVTIERAVKDYGSLGLVVAVHPIGPYTIVEYECEKVRVFGSYINGQNTSTSFDSLEGALVHCVAQKAMGLNSHQIVNFFLKGVGLR